MSKHRKNKPASADSGPISSIIAASSSAQAPKKTKKEQEEVKPPNSVEKFFIFLKDAKNELTRVTWPTRKETVTSTGILLVLVGISAVYLALVDGILNRLLRLIVG
ncbi:MAG: preprotein translocase subunit SecE [Deltaproteobacteria bacterium]|nr:preprotein translocase subunit SecE [Deltaproteobacteria bacterium]